MKKRIFYQLFGGSAKKTNLMDQFIIFEDIRLSLYNVTALKSKEGLVGKPDILILFENIIKVIQNSPTSPTEAMATNIFQNPKIMSTFNQ